jgi:hypothetical protein
MEMGIFFQPWVGKEYDNSKRKILILGESHYNDVPETEDFTKTVVERYVSGNWNHRFFTSISRVISGLSAWETRFKRAEIWSPLSFYNYIQQYVAKDSRLGYCPNKVAKYHDAFEELLETYSPDFILVFSKRLWNDMLEGEPMEVHSAGIPLRKYKHSKGFSIGVQFNHPSGRGFNTHETYHKLQVLLNS